MTKRGGHAPPLRLTEGEYSMKYMVILRDGSILTNTDDAARAVRICQANDGSSVITTDWKKTIYSNHGLYAGFLMQCQRYGWTVENDRKQLEQYRNWLKSPVYGRR